MNSLMNSIVSSNPSAISVTSFDENVPFSFENHQALDDPSKY